MASDDRPDHRLAPTYPGSELDYCGRCGEVWPCEVVRLRAAVSAGGEAPRAFKAGDRVIDADGDEGVIAEGPTYWVDYEGLARMSILADHLSLAAAGGAPEPEDAPGRSTDG